MSENRIQVVGNCSKHPGQNFVNCPMCAIEEQEQFAKQKYHAVEYGGRWQIQASPFYEDYHTDIFDAEAVGEEQAEKNAKLVEKLLNEYHEKQKQ